MSGWTRGQLEERTGLIFDYDIEVDGGTVDRKDFMGFDCRSIKTGDICVRDDDSEVEFIGPVETCLWPEIGKAYAFYVHEDIRLLLYKQDGSCISEQANVIRKKISKKRLTGFIKIYPDYGPLFFPDGPAPDHFYGCDAIASIDLSRLNIEYEEGEGL